MSTLVIWADRVVSGVGVVWCGELVRWACRELERCVSVGVWSQEHLVCQARRSCGGMGSLSRLFNVGVGVDGCVRCRRGVR